MELSGFGKEYFRQLLTVLVEKTQGYPCKYFERVADEPISASEKTLRLYRLRPIVDKAKYMGLKKFSQMPESLRVYHGREEWIQDAMRILIEQAPHYDPLRLPSFNRFILSRVKYRLLDIQRALFRKDALPEEELRQAAELHDEDSLSPERRIVQEEQRRALWGCIEQLDLRYKLLFVLHEFEQVAFQEIFEKFGGFLDSTNQSTFQRRYKKNIFLAVQHCVKSRYQK